MVDWKNVKCNKCPSFKKCQGKVSKGSKQCLINKGYRFNEPKKKATNVTHMLLHRFLKKKE